MKEDFLTKLLTDFDGFQDEDFEEFFSENESTICGVNLSLRYDKNFDYKKHLLEKESYSELITELYMSDSQMFMLYLVHYIIQYWDDDYIVDKYNRLEDEYGEDLSGSGLDIDDLNELDYLYMSDVKVYEIQTKNYKYRFEYCRGEEWFSEIGLISINEEFKSNLSNNEKNKSHVEVENEKYKKNENSLVHFYLTSANPSFPTRTECPKCQKTESIDGYNRIQTSHRSIYLFQYQCQSCGKFHFSDEKAEHGIIVALKERCECSGQYRRDKNIFCSCGYRKTRQNKEEKFLTAGQEYIDNINQQNKEERD